MEIECYRTPDGKIPYKKWYDSLKDEQVKYKIQSRLYRLSVGNYGDYKDLKSGLYELRFNNGIRIYYTVLENKIVILFHGGTKNTKGEQSKDIAKARSFLAQMSDMQE